MEASLCTPHAIGEQRTIAREIFAPMVGIGDRTGRSPVLRAEGLVASTQAYFSRSRSLRTTTTTCGTRGGAGEHDRGNLKGVMPPQTRISTPVVLEEGELAALLTTSRRLSRFCFTAEGDSPGEATSGIGNNETDSERSR